MATTASHTCCIRCFEMCSATFLWLCSTLGTIRCNADCSTLAAWCTCVLGGLSLFRALATTEMVA